MMYLHHVAQHIFSYIFLKNRLRNSRYIVPQFELSPPQPQARYLSQMYTVNVFLSYSNRRFFFFKVRIQLMCFYHIPKGDFFHTKFLKLK